MVIQLVILIRLFHNHLNKDTEAYKFLSSKTYKYGIELGKFTNIVAPIVGNILTGYVVYKKYITSTSNKFNDGNYQEPLKYPGNNPDKQPAPGFERRGSGDPSTGKGNWYNPVAKEMLHPDLKHPAPIGPHWDYTDASGIEYRLMPNGVMVPKYGGK